MHVLNKCSCERAVYTVAVGSGFSILGRVYDIRLLMLIASPNSSTAELRSFQSSASPPFRIKNWTQSPIDDPGILYRWLLKPSTVRDFILRSNKFAGTHIFNRAFRQQPRLQAATRVKLKARLAGRQERRTTSYVEKTQFAISRNALLIRFSGSIDCGLQRQMIVIACDDGHCPKFQPFCRMASSQTDLPAVKIRIGRESDLPARRSIPRRLSYGWDSSLVSSSYIAVEGLCDEGFSDMAAWRRAIELSLGARWGGCASSSAEIVSGLIEPLGFWLRPSQGMKNLEAKNDCRYSASSFPCVSHNSD